MKRSSSFHDDFDDSNQDFLKQKHKPDSKERGWALFWQISQTSVNAVSLDSTLHTAFIFWTLFITNRLNWDSSMDIDFISGTSVITTL